MTAFEGMCIGYSGGVVTTLICVLIGVYFNRKEKDMSGINNIQYNKMLEEYKKDGKFSDYVRGCMRNYGTTVREELHKQITWEYYKSVTEGVNKEV